MSLPGFIVLRRDEINVYVFTRAGRLEAAAESLALQLRPMVSTADEETPRRDDAMMLRVGAKALRQLAEMWEAEATRREQEG